MIGISQYLSAIEPLIFTTTIMLSKHLAQEMSIVASQTDVREEAM
jgi:hypothetical protein